MRMVLLLLVLAACSSDPSADGIGDPDAMAEPDGAVPIALEPGTYALDWTCIDGCGTLPFPPSTFNRLTVGAGVTWETAGAVNAMDAELAPTDSLCVDTGALAWSNGSTGPIQFCAALDGPEADVVYTAMFGPTPERSYRVKARPMPPG